MQDSNNTATVSTLVEATTPTVTAENKQITTQELFEIVKDLSVKDNDGEVNLTPIAKAFGKEVKQWTRNKLTQEILAEIQNTVASNSPHGITRTKQAGNSQEQGTFTNNPDVFLEFLRYCDFRIAVRMTKIVSELFSEGTVSVEPQQKSTKDILLLQLFSQDPLVVANAHKELVQLETKPLLQKIEADKPFTNLGQNIASVTDTILISEFVKLFPPHWNLGEVNFYDNLKQII